MVSLGELSLTLYLLHMLRQDELQSLKFTSEKEVKELDTET